MGTLEDMKGNVVGLDTSPLICFFEKNTNYHPLVRPFFVALSRGEISAVTSTITLVETLVYPIRNNRHELARRYQDLLLNTANLSTFDVSSAMPKKQLQFVPVINSELQMPFNWQPHWRGAQLFF